MYCPINNVNNKNDNSNDHGQSYCFKETGTVTINPCFGSVLLCYFHTFTDS